MKTCFSCIWDVPGLPLEKKCLRNIPTNPLNDCKFHENFSEAYGAFLVYLVDDKFYLNRHGERSAELPENIQNIIKVYKIYQNL